MSKGSQAVASPSLVANIKELDSLSFLLERPEKQRIDRAPFAYLNLFNALYLFKNILFWDWARIKLFVPILLAILACNGLVWLLVHWSIRLRAYMRYTTCSDLHDASHCQVNPAAFSGAKEIVLLQRRQLDEEAELSFLYRKQRYCWNSEAKQFERLKYPVEETFGTYRKSTGLGTESRVLSALERWGPNAFEVPLPSFGILLQEQLLAPFFVFQAFCVGLWSLDDYWMYSAFTRMKAGSSSRHPVHGRPPGVGGEERTVPADCLLLAGTCIVEEAVLTGESTPQWKAPVGAPAEGDEELSEVDPSARLSIPQHKGHILFGGTRVLQHTCDKGSRIRTPDGGCLAVVLRTGFETGQGQLMRTILFSTERVTANSWEAGAFILFLLIFAIAAAGYVLYYALQDPERSRYKLLLNCSMIITSVIPPELPMELSMAVNASLMALMRKRVFCTEPFRIPLAGKVAICCFDKTGTLTSDNLILEGLTGLAGRGQDLVKDVKQASPEVLRVMASCQSLIQVDGDIVGDPLEKASFQATGWSLNGSTCVSPKQGKHKETASVLHRYHFSSALKRMSAIVKVEDESTSMPVLWVVLKGAPEVVRQFLAHPPADYDQSYKRFAAQGARVIALAYKRLPSSTATSELRSMSRDDIESGLDFGGFAVFHCPLKPESEPALRILKESSHQLVMITGDAPLTACHTAAQLHIVDRPVLVLQHRGQEAGVGGGPDPHHQEADGSYEWYDLAISGEGLGHLHDIRAEDTFVPMTQVFARSAVPNGIASQGKVLANGPAGQQVVKKTGGYGSRMLENLEKQGKPVDERMRRMADWMDSMDTGDDGQVPMVKPGDASMAAPFTAKESSVMPCTDIIKQGRSTLVTTIQMFKILGLICLNSAYILSVMYLQGVKMSDTQATSHGMVSAGLFFVISSAKPLQTLSAERPHTRIFCVYVFASLMGQFVINTAYLIYMYTCAIAMMPAEDAQKPDTDFKANLVNSVCFIIQFFIQLSTFAVNYMGHPHNASLRENRPLFTTILYSTAFICALLFDVPRGLASWFSLVPIPDIIRYKMVGLGISVLVVTYVWEHWLRRAFPEPLPPQKGYLAFVEADKHNRMQKKQQ
ncbi:hypothetical protein WJX84_012056 [Apatococcus fuscideae]|uniref:P-type ATPase A domain-containing protein n=1 Tax=Apatococcus fuscideae TaxID=2026836 RepID=A0AAW1SH60_9CHLO